MSRNKIISVLGASNVDITGFTDHKLIYGDANIGHSKTSSGGVGRNIAENLHRLGFTINLISVFGEDPLSDFLIKSCQDLGLNIQASIFLKDQNAGTFIAIMDCHNDLALGISAMDIYNKLDIKLIQPKINSLAQPEYFVLETNFPASILESVAKENKNSKLVLDTVSGKKSLRAKNILPYLYILKTNLLEAQMLSGSEKTSTNPTKLIKYFLNIGVKKVFITLGKDGVIYGDKTGVYEHKTIPTKIENTIGAGDAFVSGIVYADAQNKDIHQMALYGMASASINVQHNAAVSPNMNIKNLKKIVKGQ